MDKPAHSQRRACLQWTALAFAAAALLVTGCGEPTAPPQATASPATYFPIRVGDTTLQLQLATTPAEKQRGLMERSSLPPGHGMLFVFHSAGQRSFWMLNTPLPLDLAYADPSGTIREIHPLIPFNLNSVESQSNMIALAIEVNRGDLRQHNIRVGSTINLEDVRLAIRQRGQNPARYAVGD